MASDSGLIKSATNFTLKHGGAFLVITMWGLSFVSTKVVMEDGGMSPTEAYIYRFIIAYLLVLLLCHKRLFCNNWRDEALMMLCGVSGGSLYFILENTALQYTLTSNVSLLTGTSPLLTMLLVGLLYKNEAPGRGAIVGSAIAFTGAICVILNSSTSLQINPLGDFLALGAAMCWAAYSVVIKKLDVFYDAWFITRKSFFYGIITAIPFLFAEPHLSNPIAVLTNPAVIGNILFLSVGASVLSYYLWAITIKKLGAVKTNEYLYIQPIITLVASAIILGERISWIGYLGFALILLGLWLGDYLQRKWQMRR